MLHYGTCKICSFLFKQSGRHLELLMHVTFERVAFARWLQSRRIVRFGGIRVDLDRDLLRLSMLRTQSRKGSPQDRLYRFVLTAVVYTYRSIVDDADVHHGLEDAVLDSIFAVERSDLRHESIVKLFAFRWGSRMMEGGRVFLNGCKKRELGDFRHDDS